MAAGAFDENGLALAPVDTTFAVQLNAQQYEEALKRGMVYGLTHPDCQAGPVRGARGAARPEPGGHRIGAAVCGDSERGERPLNAFRHHAPRRRVADGG